MSTGPYHGCLRAENELMIDREHTLKVLFYSDRFSYAQFSYKISDFALLGLILALFWLVSHF